MIKTTARLVGLLLILTGLVWILQGINILPGSFMTGQIRWAYYGTLAFLAGVAMIAFAGRRGR